MAGLTAANLSNKFVANESVGYLPGVRGMKLRKAGANWVEGDRFYDREVELEALRERVEDGTHTLLTAQRRMGKTSLVRELLRLLEDEGEFATVFVDLEASQTPQGAVAEIAARSKPIQGAWERIRSGFGNVLSGVLDRIDTLSWGTAGETPRGSRRGQLAAEGRRGLPGAQRERPAGGARARRTPDSRQPAPQGAGLQHYPGAPGGGRHGLVVAPQERTGAPGRVSMILSGSVGLEPILRQAGLSAHANIFAPFDLHPWDEETASACLAALANNYSLDLPPDVRREMCRRLRCNVPHHVQQFFDCLHEHLRRARRRVASLADVEHAYTEEMLGPRGQIDLDHYESRLKMVLGTGLYRVALELLTEAAVGGGTLPNTAVDLYRRRFPPEEDGDPTPVESVLNVLEHDGYLARRDHGYRFVSGVLEEWWRARHGRYFVTIDRREA